MENETDGLIESLYNDSSIKSRIATYYITFHIYIKELKNYVTNAKALIVDIDNYLKNNRN